MGQARPASLQVQVISIPFPVCSFGLMTETGRICHRRRGFRTGRWTNSPSESWACEARSACGAGRNPRPMGMPDCAIRSGSIGDGDRHLSPGLDCVFLTRGTVALDDNTSTSAVDEAFSVTSTTVSLPARAPTGGGFGCRVKFSGGVGGYPHTRRAETESFMRP